MIRNKIFIELELITVTTLNSHIFLRQKRCEYLGKCDYSDDCESQFVTNRIIEGFRIEGKD